MPEMLAVILWSTWGVPLMVGRPVGSVLSVVSSVSATASLSEIVPVASASASTDPMGLESVRVMVSGSSSSESVRTGTWMVWDGCPGRKVRVPLAAV